MSRFRRVGFNARELVRRDELCTIRLPCPRPIAIVRHKVVVLFLLPVYRSIDRNFGMRRAGLVENSVGRVLFRAAHRSMESRLFAFLDNGNPKLTTKLNHKFFQ